MDRSRPRPGRDLHCPAGDHCEPGALAHALGFPANADRRAHRGAVQLLQAEHPRLHLHRPIGAPQRPRDSAGGSAGAGTCPLDHRATDISIDPAGALWILAANESGGNRTTRRLLNGHLSTWDGQTWTPTQSNSANRSSRTSSVSASTATQSSSAGIADPPPSSSCATHGRPTEGFSLVPSGSGV